MQSSLKLQHLSFYCDHHTIKMLLGLRVVRGPDWKWRDQDKGEGSVGTLVKYGTQSSEVIVNSTTFVQWDTGGHANYRVGRDGAYDLRLFDTAITGSTHAGNPCCECKDKLLVGIRWKCVTCDDVSLCSKCYGSDVHSVSHEFIRYDWPFSVGCKVSARQCSKKIEAKGIFVGATVIRGPDWQWDKQDGGPGSRGLVLEQVNRPESSSWSSLYEVVWNSGVTNQYRCGFEGKIDLQAVEPATGGFYYPDHLACLGQEGSLPNSAESNTIASAPGGIFRPTVGSMVQINLDQDVFAALQEGHGGWNPSMIILIGCTGRVKKILGNDTIAVHFEGSVNKALYLNSAVVSPVTQRIRNGDMVKITEDKVRAIQLQDGHGGWTSPMENTLGRIGMVVSDNNNMDVRVFIDNHAWNFSPGNVTLVEGGPTGESLSDETLKESLEESSEDGSSDSDDDENSSGVSFGQLSMQSIMRSMFSRSLVNAAGTGNIVEVQSILSRGSDGGIDSEHMTNALNAAALKGHVEIVRLLLIAGADVSEKDGNGNAPVHSAVIENHPEVLVVLKEHDGCDLNVTNVEGLSPLHIAVLYGHLQCVDKLLALGCNANVVDENGLTALHIAIQRKNNEIVDLMTSFTVQFEYRINNAAHGLSALHYAAQMNNSYAAEKIVKRAPFSTDQQNKDGFTALHLAAQGGHFQVAQILIRNGRANLEMKSLTNQTALLCAVQQGSAAVIELIVSKGAMVDCPDSDGNTPLHSAISHCQQKAANVSEPTDLENAKTISEILGGLPTDLKNRGWVAVSCYLVKCGADFGWGNSSGQTPFDSLSDDRTIIDILLQFIDNKRFTQQCKRCAKKKIMATTLPCGHHVMCQECSKKESKCVTCKKVIQHVFSSEVKESNKPLGAVQQKAVAGSTPGRWPCETCFKQRNFMFLPCQHTCCTECEEKIGPNCPFCNSIIKRPFVMLFASSFY